MLLTTSYNCHIIAAVLAQPVSRWELRSCLLLTLVFLTLPLAIAPRIYRMTHTFARALEHVSLES